MYSILIVSDAIDPFSELESHLKKDYLHVNFKHRHEVDKSLSELKDYDYVLLHLQPDHTENEMMIRKIKNHAHCPINAFSSSIDVEHQEHLYEVGCEGYYRIPFNAKLVASKIKSVIRFINRSRYIKADVLHVGKLTLHMTNREVYLDGNVISLTNVEFKIMQILVENHDLVVSKDRIIHHVWDEDASATDNALGIHITRLRKKIVCDAKTSVIETVWGLGYRLNMKLCNS